MLLSLFAHLERVVPAHWLVGVGSADEEAPLVQLGNDADVVLALGLEKRKKKRLYY